ncbi:hypothetical protein P171DRAFT_521308 [Karstenula rhodostoma CBS 690.94]|uniref:Uncharacterized protein n=1 Tax=Karstenula rhodostoma CBS 690.94 TaxID=1392251 RepID=A0A9P4UDM1_9PLEO|nr:hypothetical protein P171DRAFT_521308 [Karstenula rhodostoma CBS 690.94]
MTADAVEKHGTAYTCKAVRRGVSHEELRYSSILTFEQSGHPAGTMAQHQQNHREDHGYTHLQSTRDEPGCSSSPRARAPSSGSSTSHLHPTASSSSAASHRSGGSSMSRPEIRRVSGQFNAPTHIEIQRHKKDKTSRETMMGSRRSGMEIREQRSLGSRVKGWLSFWTL